MLTLIALVVGLGVGGVATAVWLRASSGSAVRRSDEERRRVVADAEREAETMRREAQVEARELAVRLRADAEREVQDRRVEIAKVEERVAQRESEIDHKLLEMTRREQGVGDREVHLKQLQDELKLSRDQSLKELERISGLTLGEAKATVLERSQDLVRHELARSVRQMEEEARMDSRRRARALVADALQRVAASHTAETTVTVVELASDDMKGRIIGREGRNIRALEHLDRRRRDRRRHPARGRPLLLRRDSARGREGDAREAHRGRADPPGADRGDVLPVEGGARGADPPGRFPGRLRGELRRVQRGARADPRPVALPYELRAERAASTRSRSSTSPESWPPSSVPESRPPSGPRCSTTSGRR